MGRLRIVGQELGFILLFAWDGYEESDHKKEHKKTFIEQLHLATNDRVSPQIIVIRIPP
jgi:hypothetical protein